MAATLMGVLKDEITRLARKVVKSKIAPVQSASASHRRAISELKRQVAFLEKNVRQLMKQTAKADRTATATATAPGAETNTRFQARGLRSLRARLGLSREQFARLAGVSDQSIYNWESEKAQPRSAQIAAIAQLRSLGKREARARLDTLESNG
ncbi:MAG TPA: helix-turn-helix transcriptional regulator [Vicinamibacterales bacterium]|nr:helix-turn-helix transcriptional regulator [Vicinamibacterales bacterium]